LTPAFKSNLVWQKTSSTIADIVPNLMVIISKWNRMEVTGTYKLLCNLLVAAFKKKFEFELNSPIYNVASILLVSNLKHWFKRADCVEFRRTGLDNIVPVATGFLERKKSNLNRSSSASGLSTSSSIDSLGAWNDDDNNEDECLITAEMLSLSYNICKNKSGNMSADTIITRSMLKANMSILNKLSVTQLND